MSPQRQRKAPVYRVIPSQEKIEQLRRAVAPLMGMSEADLVALAPDRTGFRYVGCPHCKEGARETQLDWSIEDPHCVRCRYCGMIYPNDRYPQDRALRVVNPAGVEVVYPFYENAQGYRCFFSGKAWFEARFYLAGRARDLGALYRATGDRQYARRAALILDAFARHYPGFIVWEDVACYPKVAVLNPPYPRRGGKWGEWRYTEIPTDLALAYDAISDSEELERLSDETGVDVRARIEDDFFRAAVRQDDYHGPLYTNASHHTYEGYAVVGRVLGEPALVHEAVRRSRTLFERWYFLDGFWCQGTPGYHRYATCGMQKVFEALKGHSDPPGYVDPADGTRFDGLDIERDFPVFRQALRILDIFRYPDGRRVPTHDAWARFDDLAVPEQSVSRLFAGMGHAWLGRGMGGEQTQVHLHFSEGGFGHDHADHLNLMLFAGGEELFSDVGYTHTRYKPWAMSTLCHNTVLIDERQQYTKGDQGSSDGRLLAFETAFAPVQWMEASAERAYPGLAEVYRRMVMLVEAEEDEVYVVDLFRVKGGSQHDWVIHGSADRDSVAAVNLPLAPYGENLLPGASVRYPAHERDAGDAEGRNLSYAFFQNAHRGMAPDRVAVTFSLSGSPMGVRTHLMGVDGSEVFLGDAPSIRRAQENETFLDRHRMPIFLARRRGAAPLSSCFVAVHEPYRGASFIEEVRLEVCADGGEAVALSIRHHGVTDHIVHRTAPGETVVGDLRLCGEVAFVREQEGVPVMMGLWGGTRLGWRDHVLRGSGVYEGEVCRVLRSEAGDEGDALVVTGELPEGDVLKGATAIVRFGDGSTLGYRLAEVRRVNGETRLMIEGDPGISVDGGGMRFLFCPGREILGQVTCRIRGAAFARPGE